MQEKKPHEVSDEQIATDIEDIFKSYFMKPNFVSDFKCVLFDICSEIYLNSTWVIGTISYTYISLEVCLNVMLVFQLQQI